ncbi:MAG TPA: ROK family protein [Polyangiaceae bacterium]|nr:ROK family protein [Polyangiaceae bacterium]
MIGIDFGGTKIKVGRVSGATVVQAESVATGSAAGPSEILDLIANTVRKIEPHPKAAGLAVPGIVSPDGVCFRLPNVPGFEGVNLAVELGSRLDCRVVVENDATTAALAEMVQGHGRNYPSFLMLTLGTGIGGGLVLDRHLRRGAHGFAGEVGHTPIERSETAWVCGCGLRGCLESYSGTKGLLRRYAELGGAATEILPIANAARRGEAAACETFAMMGRALGIGIAGFQNTLDLDAVVFTGGISSSFDLIQPSLTKALAEFAFAPPLAAVPLLVSELGDRTGLLGAAYLTTL